jgi:hypothetical protein
MYGGLYFRSHGRKLDFRSESNMLSAGARTVRKRLMPIQCDIILRCLQRTPADRETQIEKGV